jgi:hypothetical protein
MDQLSRGALDPRREMNDPADNDYTWLSPKRILVFDNLRASGPLG